MTTVAEIMAEIEKLSPTEQRELAAWIEDDAAMIHAADRLFIMNDEAERAG